MWQNKVKIICILLLSCAVSCKKKGSSPEPVNQLPIANAGTDITITLPTSSVTLNGSASSDPDGSISAYQWTYVSGPTGSIIVNETSATTAVNNLSAGTYIFQLKVTDNKGASATARVQVTVFAATDIDPPAYGTPYSSVPATEDIVMYEINERAFSVAGNFQGIIDRLDSIKALGVNVIWLMPIHPIGTTKSVNSPYCVANYKEVNPEFGTLDILRNLVSSAHQKNMAVMLDWVANHTSWDNPWITNKSWYTQDAAGNIISPPGTGWNDVADLNYNNADMRLAMIKAMKYWVLAANIDGFRTDAADMVPFDFWKQAIDTLKNMPGRNLLFLAEGSRADHFTAGYQMNYAWDFYTTIKNVFRSSAAASNLFTTNTSEYSSIPSGKKKLRFTTNHDQSAWEATPYTLFYGKQGALAASVITSYLNGVPLLYSSQEVGRSTTVPFFSKSPIDWTQNPDMVTAYKTMFAFYNSSNALRKGTLTAYPDNDIASFKKVYNTEEVVVLVNTRNSVINYTLPSALANTNWTNAFTNASVNLSTSISINPYEYIVLKK
ncbi:MAG: PKD domain-containing protein [Sphingobacteriales bacterium]|nr:MAG: PKD domain-containing protein [Sphingobacteriales bacterium]